MPDCYERPWEHSVLGAAPARVAFLAGLLCGLIVTAPAAWLLFGS